MWLPGQLLTDLIFMQALYVVTPPRLGVEEVENSFTWGRGRGTELASPASAEDTDEVAMHEASPRYETKKTHISLHLFCHPYNGLLTRMLMPGTASVHGRTNASLRNIAWC